MPSRKSKSEPNSRASTFLKGKKNTRTKLICRQCQAVYDSKSWMPFRDMNPKMVDQLKISICPACHEKISHISDGVLHLSGLGVKAHKKDILNLVNNMGKEAENKNILNRIERIEDNSKGIMVYTTINQLAVKIGKAVSNAYKGGKLDIKWSKKDKPVEVYWTYDKVKK